MSIFKHRDIVNALRYPYFYPHHDFVFQNGTYRNLIFSRDILTSDSVFCIASGSNASPVQLKRKFGARDTPIFCVKTEVPDFFCVYSNHYSNYGSIPATVLRERFSRSQIFINILSRDDLQILEESETRNGNYTLVDHEVENTLFGFSNLFSFKSTHGPMYIDKEYVYSSPMDSHSINQIHIQKKVFALLKIKGDFLTHLKQVVRNMEYRNRCQQIMSNMLSCD